MNSPRVKSVVRFGDGDILDLPGSPDVVYSPGHTIGHACFYMLQSKTLLTGDALVTRDVLNHHDGARSESRYPIWRGSSPQT